MYARSFGLPIADDASNRDPSYRRNAIRHEVLPVLERVSPGATGNLAKFASLAADDSDYLEAVAARYLDGIGPDTALDRAWLRGMPLAVRRRVVRSWIVRGSPPGLEIPLHRVEEVLKVASTPGGPRVVEVGRGCRVEVAGSEVRLVVTVQ
jgi:tRNA(Ile)-lysidine synthase